MAHEQTDSEFVSHVPCESCGSSDANSLYDDGHQYCFGCQTYVKGDGDSGSVGGTTEVTPKEPLEKDLLSGKPQELGKRGLDLTTTRKWGYHVGKDKAGRTVQIANYLSKDRKVVAPSSP
jgi:twinkle protein